jgi:hypothetical protein
VQDYYEIRRYQLRNGSQGKRFDDFFREVLIPNLNLRGIQPVGAFGSFIGDLHPAVYLVTRYASLEVLLATRAWMAADPELTRAGEAFLGAPATDPAFLGYETSLLLALTEMPVLEVPPAALENRPRIYELRRYESHSDQALRKKIEMFNVAEISIFRRTGLTPVFFGETLIGPRMPNLTYLLVFDDLAARERNWAAFRDDPEWKRLWATPGFTDSEIVSNIQSVLLKPAPYSQL